MHMLPPNRTVRKPRKGHHPCLYLQESWRYGKYSMDLCSLCIIVCAEARCTGWFPEVKITRFQSEPAKQWEQRSLSSPSWKAGLWCPSVCQLEDISVAAWTVVSLLVLMSYSSSSFTSLFLSFVLHSATNDPHPSFPQFMYLIIFKQGGFVVCHYLFYFLWLSHIHSIIISPINFLLSPSSPPMTPQVHGQSVYNYCCTHIKPTELMLLICTRVWGLTVLDHSSWAHPWGRLFSLFSGHWLPAALHVGAGLGRLPTSAAVFTGVPVSRVLQCHCHIKKTLCSCRCSGILALTVFCSLFSNVWIFFTC